MTAIEICLIVAGVILMVGSFFITEKLSPGEMEEIAKLSQEEVAHIIDKEIESSHGKVQKQLEMELDEVLAKLDQESDKETNEKIMAISDYSDTVMEAINKSHNEIMFLYSMLGDKHKEVIDFSNDLQSRVDKMQQFVTDELVAEAVQKAEAEFQEARSIAATARTAQATQAIAAEPEAVKDQEGVPAEGQDAAEATEASGEAEKELSENEKILALHRQDKSDVEIAKELGIGLGIVKLVIELYETEEQAE